MLIGTTDGSGSIIGLYDGENLIATEMSDVHGNWQFSGSLSNDVAHDLHVASVDLAGNVARGRDWMIVGTDGADSLQGGAGTDIIFGGDGDDMVRGGTGADRLSGGAGHDIISYASAGDSKPGAADVITDFQHGSDKFDFRALPGNGDAHGDAQFQGLLEASGAQRLNAHSAAYMEVEGHTQLLVNTSNSAEIVSSTDMRSADMHIVLVGIHLGLTDGDFLV
jgi:Ca2+-binding RTX toxin-like protein